MADCKACGKKIGFLDPGTGSTCLSCHKRLEEAGIADAASKQQLKLEAVERTARQREAEIEAVLLTTETAPNLNITKRLEIVTAETAFGMNIFKDLSAGVRDIVGGRSKAVQNTMREARKTALYELKAEAHAVGANAVVAVDLDYVELSGAGSMVMLVASGTAVVIED